MDEIAKNHHAGRAWLAVAAQLNEALGQRGAHPARTVVLLPYAQLMPQAAAAWAQVCGTAGFSPRFETTMNWAGGEGGFVPGPDDISFDMATDILKAAALLDSVGQSASRDMLANRVVEAAHDLARLAAAVAELQRAEWADRMRTALSAVPGGMMDSPLLRLEAIAAQLALLWAQTSSYATDILFEADLDCFVLIEGFQSDPLGQALLRQFGAKAFTLAVPVEGPALLPALHAASHSEDEAARAAACVLAHLAAGRAPVALVAQDRTLTRRIRAMLGARGVLIRDETGWKLSTTRAAAQLMSLLRAAVRDASADAVLDWLKNAPAFNAGEVTAAEVLMRRNGVREWRGLAPLHPVAAQANALRESLQGARPLARWLQDLRGALRQSGQLGGLVNDAAGDAVLSALRLHEGGEGEFAHLPRRMDLHAFTAWVNSALEDASFKPTHPARAQVVLLPLSQLLGRPFAAVVLPGCDEVRLPVSPEPTGAWTAAQRAALGMPSREEMAAASRAAWNYALRSPWMDVLWRESEGGEHLLPSGFVQELMLGHAWQPAPDPRALRELVTLPGLRPQPVGSALPLQQLSASAYGDLRACPYRFFALRQLRLQEADELDSEVDKRDFGNWLHLVLRIFHERLKAEPVPDGPQRVALIDEAANLAMQELNLSHSEFLPFAASWPQVRDGYLSWLARHEAQGMRFDEAEAERRQPLGEVTLFGRIDRIDRLPDGRAIVIDYKTEGRSTTADRIKDPTEDTQLAFYAALLPDDELQAAYVNLGERDGTKTYEQADVVEARDALVHGIVLDMKRIGQGAALAALGEGMACEYCAARGLCRKDFWEVI